jgi:hypothetical protein
MQLTDFEGSLTVNTVDDLLARLMSIRRGDYGAFDLSHTNDYPALSIHLNRNIAYLHYFPADGHAGHQPRDMTPDGCDGHRHFLQTNHCEADSFHMPNYTLVSAETAYAAAVDFFHAPELPESIRWFEL